MREVDAILARANEHLRRMFLLACEAAELSDWADQQMSPKRYLRDRTTRLISCDRKRGNSIWSSP